MRVIAIPNVSEGRKPDIIDRLAGAIVGEGARILNVHTDPVHHRSVFTCAGDRLPHAMAGLAGVACDVVDLRNHDGVHPRLGALDVCPFVPVEDDVAPAVNAAERAASLMAEQGIPVYLYGRAARRGTTRDLPDLRRGGLEALMRRIKEGLVPDLGPSKVDPRTGVVCVGARRHLIAFNVWFDAPVSAARGIAAAVRTAGGGPPGIRALGLPMGGGRSQVSMNLTDPAVTGIDEAFTAIEGAARTAGVIPSETEIVGLVPARFMPEEGAQAARLLREPGRSLESVLLS